ncbi:putative acetyltransferase [compost metagenome]
MRGKWVRVSSEYRAMLFRLRGVRLGRRPCLEARIELLHRAECIELADGVSVETGVKLTVSNLCTEARALVVGTNSFIGRFSQITARQSVSIGANVMIAPFCYITETNHGMDPGRPMQEQASTWAGIRIEDDVWLGNGCTVLPGVTIGKGAVIGANSVVTHDIPPMAIAVGSPARVIKYRA